MKNEAAERLRQLNTTTLPFDLLSLLDAALAEERRHVIEQIRERLKLQVVKQDEFTWAEVYDAAATDTILDDLSTPEQDR